MTTTIEQRIKDAAIRTEAVLNTLLPSEDHTHSDEFSLSDAMRYSLFCGGKRLRPYLVFLFCRMLQGNEHDAELYASAIELIHTSSLIHDDMPCIDNDDLRRGRPTCHRVYGESGALFAGDAMQMKTFEILAGSDLSPENAVCAMNILATASGEHGMLGGQMLDMHAERRKLTLDELHALHTMKTGALIRAACALGALAGGANEAQFDAACRFAAALGLAFQIRDDMLDVIGTQEEMGKGVGTDETKNTFVRLYGLQRCEELVQRYTDLAIDALSVFPDHSFMQELALSLTTRRN